MGDMDVAASEEVVGSETSEVVAGSDSTVEDGGAVTETGAEEYKPFKFGWFDGTETELDLRDPSNVAQSLGKMNEAFRHGSMRHEQFQSERQKLEAEREAIRDQVRKATEAEQRYNTAFGQYKPWDELMTSNPALRQEIEQVIDRHRNGGSQQPQNQDALVEALLNRPELKAYQEGYQEWQKDKETREKEQRVASAVEQLKTEIPDYDDAKVSQFLQELEQVPSQDSERTLRQLIHYSILGRERAGKLEQRTDPRPGVPSVSSTPGKQTTGPEPGERTPEQEYEDALRRVANVK